MNAVVLTNKFTNREYVYFGCYGCGSNLQPVAFIEIWQKQRIMSSATDVLTTVRFTGLSSRISSRRDDDDDNASAWRRAMKMHRFLRMRIGVQLSRPAMAWTELTLPLSVVEISKSISVLLTT
jgi:hypothetical protein